LGLIRNIRKGLTFLRNDLRVGPEDAALVHEYLSPVERELFYRLSVPDQVHSVRVARICMQSLPHFPELDHRRMVRGALLHDIGKVDVHLGIVFRTIWTLLSRILRDAPERLGSRYLDARPGTLRHRMYVQSQHPALGAELLAQMGTEEGVCKLVRNTGLPPDGPRDTADRVLLAADSDRVVDRLP